MEQYNHILPMLEKVSPNPIQSLAIRACAVMTSTQFIYTSTHPYICSVTNEHTLHTVTNTRVFFLLTPLLTPVYFLLTPVLTPAYSSS